MRAEIMEVTPSLAKEWLAMNTKNRKPKKLAIQRYAHDMKTGNWQLNGQPIVLNGGVLLDGQNRLYACIEAETPFQSLVVMDAPMEVMDTIDQGVGRTLSDVLGMRGYADALSLAATVRSMWRWQQTGILNPHGHPVPSVGQALAWLNENPDVVSATRFAKRLSGSPIRLRISIGGAIYLVTMRYDSEAAHEFFDRILDGEHLAKGSPVYALRRILVRNTTSIHHKMPAVSMAAYVIKAWNFWIMGDPAEFLRMSRDVTLRQNFPVLIDREGNPLPGQGK